MRNRVGTFLDNWGLRHRIDNGLIIIKGSGLRVKLPHVNGDIAYLLGYICGDGCLPKPLPRKRKGGFRFKIAICFPGSERGRNHLLRISNIFEKHFNYRPIVLRVNRNNRKEWFAMETNSAAIYAFLYQLGLPVGEKYGKLKVPTSVRRSQLFKEFMKGLIDSDGHIKADGRIVIVQKDLRFLRQIRKLCSTLLNIYFTVPKTNSKKVGGKIYTWYYIMSLKSEISSLLSASSSPYEE